MDYNYTEEKHPNDWDFFDYLVYIKNNYFKFLLLLLVVIIIVSVDHITNINSLIFTLPSAVPIPGQTNTSSSIKLNKKMKKKK